MKLLTPAGSAKAVQPDLMLMDVRLAGGGDGVDTALELFHEMGLRRLLATAHHDSRTRLRAQSAQPLG